MARDRLHRGELTLHDVPAATAVGSSAHYADPAYYTKTYKKRDEDVRFYRRLCRAAKGPVLEYGVGNGRIALPVARSGVEVVGVDLSRPMLADLSKQLEKEPAAVQLRVQLVHGDMRRVRLKRRFPLVIAPFNTILHLYERKDVEDFFARVREHLTPRGRFVFDFSLPRPRDLVFDENRRYKAPRFRHPTTGELTHYSERFEYDVLRQILLVSMEFKAAKAERSRSGRGLTTTALTHRQFFPQEMEALLHYNGFSGLEWSADFSDDEPDQDADSLIVSGRLARPSSAKKPRKKRSKR